MNIIATYYDDVIELIAPKIYSNADYVDRMD